MRMQYIAVLFILAFLGCSKDTASTGPIEPPPPGDPLVQAWRDFEEKRYDSAILNFTDAYNKSTANAVRAEAIGGRGWAYAYKRDLARSKSDFIFALNITGITGTVRTDIWIGYAFVLYALNDFTGTISFAGATLTENPIYTFAHDSRVTTKRVRLLLAQSYYAGGQFVSAAHQMDLIDPSGAPHSADPATLLGKILAALNSL